MEKRDEACRGSRAPGKRSTRGSVRAAPRHRLHCRSGDVCGAALRAGCPAPGSLFRIQPKTEEKPLVAPISDDRAQQFATALISHCGNQTRAAIACGYKPGNAARCAGSHLSRNPRVLRLLQPMLVEHLAALTPKALKTLAGLLSHKSGYIRLKAAKDILNRNAVGMGREPVRGAPLLIRITLGSDAPAQDVTQSLSPEIAPQRRVSPPLSLDSVGDINDLTLDDPDLPTSLPTYDGSLKPQTRSDINNFSSDENTCQLAEKQPGGQKLGNKITAGSIPHDFSPKVRGEDVDLVLELEDEGTERFSAK